MTDYGQEVKPANFNSAVSEFCDWLSKQSHVYLVAHNGRKFDFPVFLSALSNINTGNSRYLELGYVEHSGYVELSWRSRPYILYK